MNRVAIGAMIALSFKEAILAKWLVFYAVVFFLLSVNVPELTLVVFGAAPADYISVQLALLVTLSFPYLPLLALPLASTSVVEERESGVLQYVLSNPLSRADFLLGRLLGLTVATTAVIMAGYGLAAIVAYSSNLLGYGVILRLMGVAILLNVSMVSVALFISILAKRKVAALGAAIFLWFVMTAISALATTGVIISLLRSPVFVLPLVLGNPVQSSSILAVLQLNLSRSELGIALGVKDLLGPDAGLILLACLAIWSAVFIIASFVVFNRQDIT